MSRRDPYRRAMRRARRSWRNRDGAYPMLIIGPDEPVGLIVAGMIAQVGMAAPVGIPPVHGHRSRIRDRCIRSSASRPMVDHHRMRHRIRHGPAGHSAQALVGTASGPVHLRNGGPAMGRLRNRPASRTRLRDHCRPRAPADGFPPLSRSARPCGHCRKSRSPER